MKYIILVCTLLLCCRPNLHAQNLVPNPGFEELTSCPAGISYDSTGIAKAKHWFTTDKGSSPDLFNECKSQYYGWLATQNVPARTGKGYAGFWCETERLEVRLKSPLIKNKMYRIQMYIYNGNGVKLPYSYPSILYFYFSKTVLTKKYIDDSLINKKVISIVNNDSNKSNSCKWELFSACYRASGGENYFTLGGLNTSKVIDEMFKEEHENILPLSAYYFIDDVSVEEDTTGSTSPPFQGKLVTGQKLTLKNIFFETAKANLLSTSDNELDTLARAMQHNPKVSLNICGYTDSTGNENANIELSTKRAEAVRSYLVGKGIASKRLNCKGFGSANPVADNRTEEGRKNNRRVEIEVTGIQ